MQPKWRKRGGRQKKMKWQLRILNLYLLPWKHWSKMTALDCGLSLSTLCLFSPGFQSWWNTWLTVWFVSKCSGICSVQIDILMAFVHFYVRLPYLSHFKPLHDLLHSYSSSAQSKDPKLCKGRPICFCYPAVSLLFLSDFESFWLVSSLSFHKYGFETRFWNC